MNTGKKRKFMMWFILLIPVFLLGLHLGAIIAYTPTFVRLTGIITVLWIWFGMFLYVKKNNYL